MTPFDLPLPVMLVLVFVGGAWLGRFAIVAIERIPRSEALADQLRSLAPRRRWWESHERFHPVLDRLPILGWLRIRRRGDLPRRYLWTEVMLGLLCAILYACEIPTDAALESGSLFTPLGPSVLDSSFERHPVLWLHLRYLFHVGLLFALLIATLVDIDTYTIPDGITVPTMILGVIGGTLLGRGWIVPVWFQDVAFIDFLQPLLPAWTGGFFLDETVPTGLLANPHLHGFLVAVLGLLLGGGAVWTMRIVSYYGLGQEGIGFGDVTLMAAVGSVVGWQVTLVSVLLGAMTALVLLVGTGFRLTKRYLPFGPFLSAGAVIALCTWRWVFPMVQAWFGLGPLLLPVFVVMAGMLLVGTRLVRLIEWAIGIDPGLAPWEEEIGWRPADQTMYLSMENVDPPRSPGGSRWDGELSARGQIVERDWAGWDD